MATRKPKEHEESLSTDSVAPVVPRYPHPSDKSDLLALYQLLLDLGIRSIGDLEVAISRAQ